MKCNRCEQPIIIHNNLINKVNEPITMDDLTSKGMIYSQEGLRGYSNTDTCEVCNDERLLNKRELKSYRLRLIK